MKTQRPRGLLVSAKRVATFVLDGLVRLVPRGRQSEGKSRLLVIKLDALGDFVLWLPVAQAFRQAFPPSSHQITLLGNQLWSELAQKTGFFDEVWPVNRERFRDDLPYRYETLLKVRRTGFDRVIQSQISREFFLGDSVVRTCGARYRVGPHGDTAVSTVQQLRISDRWYDRLIKTLPPTLAEIERNADFFRKLTGLTLENPFPRLEASWFESPIRERLPKAYFVVVPGASIRGRMWPANRYAEVSQRIVKRFGLSGVVCGDESHRELANEICDIVGTAMVDLTGQTSILDLCAVFSQAALYVGNETGPAHIAAACNVPVVVLTGGGHFGRFFPYGSPYKNGAPEISVAHVTMDCFGCDWHCPYVNLATQVAPCLENIGVDVVWQFVMSMLTCKSVTRETPSDEFQHS